MKSHWFLLLLGHCLRKQMNQVPEENGGDECSLIDKSFRDLITKTQLSLFSNRIIYRSVLFRLINQEKSMPDKRIKTQLNNTAKLFLTFRNDLLKKKSTTSYAFLSRLFSVKCYCQLYFLKLLSTFLLHLLFNSEDHHHHHILTLNVAY